jgi:hypothetical protein
MRILSSLTLAAALALSSAAAVRPCDILVAAGNPCVAAHSTVRALYAAYNGPLYNVTRASDGKSFNVSVLSAGGFANKAAHDSFCAKLDCVISNVFDQSPMGNHLGQRHQLVNASEHVITVAGGVQVRGSSGFLAAIEWAGGQKCSPRWFSHHQRRRGVSFVARR